MPVSWVRKGDTRDNVAAGHVEPSALLWTHSRVRMRDAKLVDLALG
jgi:hypothetical protein